MHKMEIFKNLMYCQIINIRHKYIGAIYESYTEIISQHPWRFIY
jgi:hypothetical protein